MDGSEIKVGDVISWKHKHLPARPIGVVTAVNESGSIIATWLENREKASCFKPVPCFDVRREAPPV